MDVFVVKHFCYYTITAAVNPVKDNLEPMVAAARTGRKWQAQAQTFEGTLPGSSGCSPGR